MSAPIGHNSGMNSTAAQQLRSIVDRLERLFSEIDEIREQIKEVLAEAKGNGFDVPLLRKVIRVRRMDRAKRQEGAQILGIYLHATGDAGSPEEGEKVNDFV